MSREIFDVLIIGAGLSGIGAARYLKKKCPQKTFAILEAKPKIGGTWELFKYPGIRSDSDMHTMGYAFKPWTNPKAISDGESIRNYIAETADENGLTEHIRFNQKVKSADWNSDEAVWTLTVEENGEIKTYQTQFLFSCAGYYKHEEGYLPTWGGEEDFEGQFVHPQFWPEDLDYTGKKVAIIGSGATAVTLTPVMAEKAAHVYQVQRSPTYVISRPTEDAHANNLQKFLPADVAYAMTRWQTILRGRMMRKQFGKDIKATKQMLIGMVAKELDGKCDVEKHWTPDYWPGQQRICAVTDGDMFNAIKDGRASMVTGHIDHFTKTGIQMKDGEHIEADIIVTATGLVLEFMGGIDVSVDGQNVDPGKLLIYKGFMYSNIPNLIYFSGYTNASWTLKVDLVAEYACRLLRYMDKKGAKQWVPLASEADFQKTGASNNFISGYFKRAHHRLPKHGAEFPWIHEQDYFWDRKTLRKGELEDGVLKISAADKIIFPESQKAESNKEAVAAE